MCMWLYSYTKKDSKQRLCAVAVRICTRYAQRHQLAKAFSKALVCFTRPLTLFGESRTGRACEVVAASHRYRVKVCVVGPSTKVCAPVHKSRRNSMWMRTCTNMRLTFVLLDYPPILLALTCSYLTAEREWIPFELHQVLGLFELPCCERICACRYFSWK